MGYHEQVSAVQFRSPLAFAAIARQVKQMRLTALEETRRSWPAPWARRLAVLSLAVLVVGLVTHWLQLLATSTFFWAMGLAAAMALVSLFLIAAATPKVWYLGYRGGRDLIVAGIYATLVLVPFALAIVWASTHPMLTDVSTDLDDPPVFDVAAKLRAPDMNPLLSASDAWKAEQLDAYPQVGGRRYEAPIEAVRGAVEKVFEARGWTPLGPYIAGAAPEYTLEATIYSLGLALPSDLVVRMIGDDEATFVDMRAASRYGDTDFGGNADLIVEFFKELDIAVSTMARVAPAPAQ